MSAGLEHHRPRFHIRPPRGWLNDPNGPVVIDGVTHLYFQYRFGTDLADPVVWGHASSTNLIDWSLHRAAITPEPTGLDRDGCFSGNTVLTDSGEVLAFYSGFRRDYPLQSALVASSTDGGASFGAARLAVEDPDGPVVRRDPFVWRTASGWHMALGEGDADERASVRRYRSTDLEVWEDEGSIVSLPRTVVDGVDTGAMWECPQVADVDGTEVVLVGAWSEENGIMRVLAVLPGLGGDRLEGVGAYPVDDGDSFYAPSVLRREGQGPLVWGWVTEARTEDWWREEGWAGAISLPREVRLAPDGRLLSAPAAELDLLRGRGTHMRLVSGQEASIGGHAELTISPAEAAVSSVRVGSAEECFRILLDPTRDRVTIDLDDSSSDDRAHRGKLTVEGAFEDGSGEVRVFLDGSILEVFTGTGRVATCRFYPVSAPPWTVRFDGAADVDVWDLM